MPGFFRQRPDPGSSRAVMRSAEERNRGRAAVVLGSVIAGTLVLAFAGASILGRLDHDQGPPGREGSPERAECDLLREAPGRPVDWVQPDGRLVLSREQAGPMALAYGMRAQFDISDRTAAAVGSLLSRRLGGQAAPLLETERTALRELSRLKEACGAGR